MVDQASTRLAELQRHVQEKDVEGFRRDTDQTPAERKAANKLFHRLEVKLVSCPSCATGRLEPAWLTDYGNDLIRTPLVAMNLSPYFVREVTNARKQLA